jgi:hypothetical protein
VKTPGHGHVQNRLSAFQEHRAARFAGEPDSDAGWTGQTVWMGQTPIFAITRLTRLTFKTF